ncbi:MAG: hypothetical protein AABX23_01065 [Nanoarchaeota archaeon]
MAGYQVKDENPRTLSIKALKVIRDSKLYKHNRYNNLDSFGSMDAFNVQFNGMDGTLLINDFSGNPELARQDVELLLKRRNLRLETHPDDLIEHGKPYNSWESMPEPLEVDN